MCPLVPPPQLPNDGQTFPVVSIVTLVPAFKVF